MFLLRTLFWLAIVIMILPTGKSNNDTMSATVTGVAVTEAPGFDTDTALDAALTAVGDLSSFCTRNPSACETGAAAAEAFKAKAKAAVRMIYEWASGDDAGTSSNMDSRDYPVGKAAEIRHDSVVDFFTGTVHLASGTKTKSQNTLRIEDIIPEWTGPRKNRSA